MNEKIKLSLRQFWFDPKGKAKLAALYAAPLFWLLLALKLVAGSLFASDFLSKLFVPFLEHFAAQPLDNPYAVFLQNGHPEAFPYPALMLYVMGVPRLVMGWVFGASLPSFALLFLYRLPLLLADLAILAVLVRWSRDKAQNVLWLYWASPVLFYITYLHGQLDVVPIALLFFALYGLFKEKFLMAAVALGFGLATKTHLAISVPFFLIYMWRQRESLRPLLPFILVMMGAFLLPNLPYLGSAAFYEMVFHNAAQKKLTLATIAFSPDAEYYVVFGVYVLLVFKALQITVQNRDLFLMFLGFSFGALLFFVAPMPGWYFWVVPFLAYFFARGAGRQGLLLWGLQAAYLLYFIVKPGADYRDIFQYLAPTFAQGPVLYDALRAKGLDAAVLVNLAYTLLQTALAVNCGWIYRRGIRGYQKHKLTSRSFLVGISGDSGSGKTTLAAAITSLFQPRNVTVICGDDMHKWQRGHVKWREMTHLDPRANELHQELEYITALRQRQTVRRRHYDHTTGQFTAEVVIRPRPIVIFEGLHSFYLKPARAMMDLKIFVKPEEDLLLHRKVVRDMKKRGYPKEQVLENIARRKEDADKYIKIQERNADIVVEFLLQKPLKEIGGAGERPELWMRLSASNAFYFDPLIADLGEALGENLRHSYDAEDRQTLEFRAFVSRDVLESLGDKHVQGLQDLGIYMPEWQEGYRGLLQLFVAWCIFADSRRTMLG